MRPIYVISALAAAAVLTIGCAGFGGTLLFPVSYNVVEVSEVGSPYVKVNGMSNNGDVVGEYRANASADDLAFVWTEADGLTPLGTLGGSESEALGVNSSGVVVGKSETGSSDRAFYFDGSMEDAGGLGTDLGSTAYAIDFNGLIVGSSINLGGFERAVFFNPGLVPTPLGTLGGLESAAMATNGQGQIVGWSLNAFGTKRAFRWTNGVMVDLGGLVNGGESEATGINASGQICGTAKNSQGDDQAFLMSGNIISALAFPPGADESWAFAINGDGIVVGSAEVGGDEFAFAWYPGNNIVDLNAMVVLPAGFSLTRAVGIDNDANIIASGYNDGTGETRGFLLKPQF